MSVHIDFLFCNMYIHIYIYIFTSWPTSSPLRQTWSFFFIAADVTYICDNTSRYGTFSRWHYIKIFTCMHIQKYSHIHMTWYRSLCCTHNFFLIFFPCVQFIHIYTNQNIHQFTFSFGMSGFSLNVLDKYTKTNVHTITFVVAFAETFCFPPIHIFLFIPFFVASSATGSVDTYKYINLHICIIICICVVPGVSPPLLQPWLLFFPPPLCLVCNTQRHAHFWNIMHCNIYIYTYTYMHVWI